RLPASLLQRRHLLRYSAHGGEHQPPRQLRGGEGRMTRMHVRGDDDAAPGAGIEIDVRPYAALRNQAQLVEALDERRADRRALADQNQCLGGLQPLGEAVHILGVVVPDLDVVPRELPEGRQMADRVEEVVQYRDFHLSQPLFLVSASTLSTISGARPT